MATCVNQACLNDNNLSTCCVWLDTSHTLLPHPRMLQLQCFISHLSFHCSHCSASLLISFVFFSFFFCLTAHLMCVTYAVVVTLFLMQSRSQSIPTSFASYMRLSKLPSPATLAPSPSEPTAFAFTCVLLCLFALICFSKCAQKVGVCMSIRAYTANTSKDSRYAHKHKNTHKNPLTCSTQLRLHRT